MSIFSGLPTVNACCLCIDLKWGSIIIAIYSILNFGSSSITKYYKECEDENNSFQSILSLCSYVIFAANLLLFIAGIVFIFGIIKGMPKTATWFMYGVLLSIVTNLIYVIISVVFSIMDSKCKYYVSIFLPAICLLIWVYFLIVVKSYREEM